MAGEYAAELRERPSTARIDEIARSYGLAGDPKRYDRFLSELLQRGVDYEGIRQSELLRGRVYIRLFDRARTAPSITLWVAAMFGRFAVCRADGTVISRGEIPVHLRGEDTDDTVDTIPIDDDTGADGIGAAYAAAQAEAASIHAVRLAGSARAATRSSAARLRLIVARRHGLRVARLRYVATSESLVLHLVTDAHGSPAAAACLEPTPVRWQRSDLAALLQPCRGASR
ncbi:hypothetical protein [Nocardia bhagyanarayanae]|uniref:hypothetical protein n=1 Tax=Nocardia bhagyanarayanae TaxID=1215925 RepID=UPI00114ED615|nr:hypothetical protein [Nocardia bhagyanarayanae]